MNEENITLESQTWAKMLLSARNYGTFKKYPHEEIEKLEKDGCKEEVYYYYDELCKMMTEPRVKIRLLADYKKYLGDCCRAKTDYDAEEAIISGIMYKSTRQVMKLIKERTALKQKKLELGM